MKLSLPKKDLASLVSAVAPAAAKKASHAALGCVKIVATDSGVAMTATDLFTGVSGRIAADVSEDGALLVSSSDLMSAVRALPDGETHITLDGNRLQLRVGKSKQRIAWSSVGDYPDLPQMDASKAVGISASTLLLAVGSVAHSVSTDDMRAHMCGVHVEIGGGRCRAMSTNGSASSLRDVECSVEGPTMLVPGKSVAPLKQALDRAKDGVVNVASHDGYMFVEHGSVTMSMKLSGESFPVEPAKKVAEMAKSKAVNCATISREMFLDEVTRVRSQDGEMPIAFTFRDGAVSMFAKCATGEAEGEVACDYSGKPVTVGFNALHLAPALAAMTADDVTFSFGGALDPAVIKHATNDECLMIVMTARL